MLDIGSGLGAELAFLADRGFAGVGIDLSAAALRHARMDQAAVRFVRADVRRLPFGTDTFDLAIDRGCFHYLERSDRSICAEECRRVLRPGGRLFLRACLRNAGVRNDIDEATLRRVFAEWRWLQLGEEELLTDTCIMPAIVALLEPAA